MKKLLLSILTLLYMTVSTGIAMEIHYCMGKQAGVDFYKQKNEKCGRCGMSEKNNGCCSDEHKFFKLNESHKNVSYVHDFVSPELDLVPIFSFGNSTLPEHETFTKAYVYEPPQDTGPSLCIKYCIFRI